MDICGGDMGLYSTLTGLHADLCISWFLSTFSSSSSFYLFIFFIKKKKFEIFLLLCKRVNIFSLVLFYFILFEIIL